jgi:hypothetical protein
MNLKGLRAKIKGLPGDLLVMRPDGKGGYIEVEEIRPEHLEMDNYDDQEALVIDPENGAPKSDG